MFFNSNLASFAGTMQKNIKTTWKGMLPTVTTMKVVIYVTRKETKNCITQLLLVK